MTTDGPSSPPAIEHEVQIAAAHAAMTHLDEHVARADLRHADLLDDEVVLAVQHGGEHLVRQRHVDAPAALDSLSFSMRSDRYSGWSASQADARCIDCSLFLLMNL